MICPDCRGRLWNGRHVKPCIPRGLKQVALCTCDPTRCPPSCSRCAELPAGVVCLALRPIAS